MLKEKIYRRYLIGDAFNYLKTRRFSEVAIKTPRNVHIPTSFAREGDGDISSTWRGWSIDHRHNLRRHQWGASPRSNGTGFPTRVIVACLSPDADAGLLPYRSSGKGQEWVENEVDEDESDDWEEYFCLFFKEFFMFTRKHGDSVPLTLCWASALRRRVSWLDTDSPVVWTWNCGRRRCFSACACCYCTSSYSLLRSP